MGEYLSNPDKILAELVEDLDDAVFKDLTPREIVFVRHYAVHGSKSAAALHAGYKPDNVRGSAAKVFARPTVQAAISVIKKKAMVACEYNAEEALRAQKVLYEKCIELKQMSAAVKAKEHLDTLAGHIDPYKMHVEVTGKSPLSIQIFGIAPPTYAAEREVIDATPKKELNGGTDPETK